MEDRIKDAPLFYPAILWLPVNVKWNLDKKSYLVIVQDSLAEEKKEIIGNSWET